MSHLAPHHPVPLLLMSAGRLRPIRPDVPYIYGLHLHLLVPAHGTASRVWVAEDQALESHLTTSCACWLRPSAPMQRPMWCCHINYTEFHELDGRGSHRRWRSGERKVLAAGAGRRQVVDHGDSSTEGEADLLKLRHGVL